jgi:hypothetical protein
MVYREAAWGLYFTTGFYTKLEKVERHKTTATPLDDRLYSL